MQASPSLVLAVFLGAAGASCANAPTETSSLESASSSYGGQTGTCYIRLKYREPTATSSGIYTRKGPIADSPSCVNDYNAALAGYQNAGWTLGEHTVVFGYSRSPMCYYRLYADGKLIEKDWQIADSATCVRYYQAAVDGYRAAGHVVTNFTTVFTPF